MLNPSPMATPQQQQSSILRHRSKQFGLIMLTLLLTVACETEKDRIPNMPVFLKRNVNQIDLLSPGKYYYIATPTLSSDRLGFGGLVLAYCYDELEPYCAFDLACPYCATATIQVSEPDSMLVCTCPNCNERYDLFYGMGIPLEGISKWPLKKYSAYIDPSNSLYIVVSP